MCVCVCAWTQFAKGLHADDNVAPEIAVLKEANVKVEATKKVRCTRTRRPPHQSALTESAPGVRMCVCMCVCVCMQLAKQVSPDMVESVARVQEAIITALNKAEKVRTQQRGRQRRKPWGSWTEQDTCLLRSGRAKTCVSVYACVQENNSIYLNKVPTFAEAGYNVQVRNAIGTQLQS